MAAPALALVALALAGPQEAAAPTSWGRIFEQQQFLLGSTPPTANRFGELVRASGDDALVAHGQFTDTVDFYRRTDGVWSLQSSVGPSAPGGWFGSGGDLSGDLAVVTDFVSGDVKAYVYVRAGSSWNEESVFGVESDVVALDGTTLAVGQGFTSSPVRVYARQGTSWSLQAELATAGYSGSLDLEGDLLVVGSENDATLGANAGAVHVFERSGTTWTGTAVLAASDAEAEEYFGAHVEHEDGWIFVGNDADQPLAGGGPNAVYAFERAGSGWTERQKLSGISANRFGQDTAATGPLLAVGRPGYFGGLGGGVLYVRQGGQWVLEEFIAPQAPFLYLQEEYGAQMAFADHQLFVGAPRTFNNFNTNAGVVFTYDVGSASYCTAGVSASGCRATLSARGLACASAASGFALSVGSVEGSKTGLFFMGTSGKQGVPWGSGTSYRCVVPPVQRLGVETPNGTNGACDGAYSIDLHAHWTANPNTNPGAGTLAQAQFWYRDPQNTSNRTTGFSDAVEFHVGP